MPWTKIRGGEVAFPRDVQRMEELWVLVEWWKVELSWMSMVVYGVVNNYCTIQEAVYIYRYFAGLGWESRVKHV